VPGPRAGLQIVRREFYCGIFWRTECVVDVYDVSVSSSEMLIEPEAAVI
jgi:hypothetical protein